MLVQTQRDFLPSHMIEQLTTLYETATDWHEDIRSHFYDLKYQSFDGLSMPRDGEQYKMSTDRSLSLEKDLFVKSVVDIIRGTSYRCYRMRPGHGLRIHNDEYFGGQCSANLYVNRNWVWDWGGLLHVLDKNGETCNVICPNHNLLVTMGLVPHFVSPVAEWAQQFRYVLAVFGIPT